MEWKDSAKVPSPTNLEIKGDRMHRTLKWKMADSLDQFDKAYNYVVYRFKGKDNINLNNPANILYITHDGEKSYRDTQALKGDVPYIYVVTAIDYMQKESEDYTRFKIDVP